MTKIGDKLSGRSCDGCALCCMVLGIDELEKPKGTWCQHCSTRQSCDIYDQRPEECSNFHCGYLVSPNIDEQWKPSKSKIILVREPYGNRITAHVHPNRPDAWKHEPFYSTLKQWSLDAAPHRGEVVVCIDRRTYMIFPDRDVDLGVVEDDHLIVTGEKQTALGIQLVAFVIHKDDPRAQQLAEQPRIIASKS